MNARKEKMNTKKLLLGLENDSLTDDEWIELKIYLEKSDDKTIYGELQSLWEEHTDDSMDKADKDRILREIEARINLSGNRKTSRISLKKLSSVAATFIVLLFCNYMFYALGYNRYDEETIVVKTQKGERTNIHLPDSSVVILNGSTCFEYPQNFSFKKRSVNFSGEAYFRIKKNDASNFTINMDELKVEVLGTEFNINTLNKDQIEVSLYSGKIKLLTNEGQDTESHYLSPGQKAIFNRKTGLTFVEKIDSGESVWLTRKLVFNAVTLAQLLRELEKAYDITINSDLPEDLANDRFTAVFSGLGLNEILHILVKYYNIDYRINNDNIHIFINH